MRNGMFRSGDHETSVQAAAAVVLKLNDLHKRIIASIIDRGPMTDEELERLPVFSAYGPSTVRKRRSELYQDGRLVAAGEKTNRRGRKMIVWDLPTQFRLLDQPDRSREPSSHPQTEPSLASSSHNHTEPQATGGTGVGDGCRRYSPHTHAGEFAFVSDLSSARTAADKPSSRDQGVSALPS